MAPIARAQMLIRRSPADVFQAFIDPAITSRFWYSSGSAKLEVGKKRWTRWVASRWYSPAARLTWSMASNSDWFQTTIPTTT